MSTAMEIVRQEREGALELLVRGRLDGYWAQHLAGAINEVLREGIHKLALNLSETTYVSSAGLRVLVDAYKQFAGVEGALRVVEPSAVVKQVLDLAGLGPLLCPDRTVERPAAPVEAVERKEVDGSLFEIYDVAPRATLACRVFGSPEALGGAAFGEAQAETLELPREVCALGLGAFGEGYAACRDRFGEFLAVAGNAASQPTDGTNYPDYMVTSGTFVPRVTALYGIAWRGAFARLLRFETSATRGPLGLGSVVSACLEAAGGQPAAMVLVAESAGLLGAALKRSPTAGDGGEVFAHPGIRQWLSFSPERGFARSVAVVAGVAACAPSPPLAALLRPLGAGSSVAGHFHAAAFGYHPLQKGKIDMQPAIAHLFSTGGLRGVVHLLWDDRSTAAAPESEFFRGACWFGPLNRIVTGEEQS
jgi:anti-anti-sigma factor